MWAHDFSRNAGSDSIANTSARGASYRTEWVNFMAAIMPHPLPS